MREWVCAICLGILAPLHAIAQETDRPYAALFDTSNLRSSPQEARQLRSIIEKEKKQQVDKCESDEKRLRAQLDSARHGLKTLNDAAPRDNGDMALSRDRLHNNIGAFEQNLRDKKRECEHIIPAEFEIKLTKAYLLQRWPDRRAHTVRKIEEGRARERKHGDVDDIGYRKLVDDQEKDIAIGQQAVRQMTLSKLGPVEVPDPVIRQYVQNLAEAIVRNSDLRTPLHVTVLESPEINAIGLPGGFLLITSGLLLASQSEAELAGIISQQIAHIAARHATRTSKRSII
jgi:Peptidase family M48